MTNSKKMSNTKLKSLEPIENDVHFHDVFAEIAGVTEFSVEGVHYVNLSFLSHRVVPFADENGKPSVSRIDVKRVASVTMTHDKAVALRNSMIRSLGDVPKGDEE